jgi:hypothetical protein
MPLWVPPFRLPGSARPGTARGPGRQRQGQQRAGGLVGVASMPAQWQEIGPVRCRGSAKLDASGNGQIYFTVYSANHRWLIYEVVVNVVTVLSPQVFPQVTLHIGGQAQAGLSEGASWNGNQETFQGQILMDACDDLTVDFAGGALNQVCTAIIEGTNYLWR